MEKKTARLEAFSDGIFGVAITLLAIEIGIGEYAAANNENLWERILEKWPEYFAYFNSFATVLLIWMGHHKMMNHLRTSNQKIILANGFLLLLVVLFPYPTKTAGTFIGTAAVNTAVSFYAGFTGLIVLGMLLLNVALMRSKEALINAEKSIPWFKQLMRGQFIGIIVYAVAAIVAFYSPMTALTMTFFMWVFWAVTTKDNNADAE